MRIHQLLTKQERRAASVKAALRRGKTTLSRLSVFRSARYIYAQVIDDTKLKTIVSASEKELDEAERLEPKVKRAFLVGKLIAQKALKKNIKKIVFDRHGYRYHGRVKMLADGAREGGLSF